MIRSIPRGRSPEGLASALGLLVGLGLGLGCDPNLSASAQQPRYRGPSPIEVLGRLDQNQDGTITLDEVHEDAHDAFAKLLELMDSNANDQIDPVEIDETLQFLDKIRRGALAQQFQAADADKDGFLSRDEFRGNANQFGFLDTNKDDRLTFEELARINAANRRRSGAPARPQPNALPDRLANMDRNNDGVVDRDEFPGQALIFDRLDRNDDGKLTPSDFVKNPSMSNASASPNLAQLRALLGRLPTMDANQDRVISQDEFRGPAPLFQRLDRDRNGRITEAEARRFERSLRRDEAQGDTKRGRKNPSDSSRSTDRRLERILGMDADGDGKITVEEY